MGLRSRRKSKCLIVNKYKSSNFVNRKWKILFGLMKGLCLKVPMGMFFYFSFCLQQSLLDTSREFLGSVFPIIFAQFLWKTKLCWQSKHDSCFIKLHSPYPILSSCTGRHVGKLQLIHSPSNNYPPQLSLLLLTTRLPDDILAILFIPNK